MIQKSFFVFEREEQKNSSKISVPGVELLRVPFILLFVLLWELNMISFAHVERETLKTRRCAC